MSKPYEVVTLFEPTSVDEDLRGRDGEFYTHETQAADAARTRHGGYATPIQSHLALRVPGGWYYLLKRAAPVAVHGTWQHNDQLKKARREAALAKLTPEEIEALGIKLS